MVGLKCLNSLFSAYLLPLHQKHLSQILSFLKNVSWPLMPQNKVQITVLYTLVPMDLSHIASQIPPQTLSDLSLLMPLLGRSDSEILIFCSSTQMSFLLSSPNPQSQALSLHTSYAHNSSRSFFTLYSLHLTCILSPPAGTRQVLNLLKSYHNFIL